MEEAVKAQKQLEENMTMTDLDNARRKLFELQETVIGKVESPLKGVTMNNINKKNVSAGTTDSSARKKRPPRRSRSRTRQGE